MEGWIICLVLLVLLIILFFRYNKKQELDRTEKHKLETDVELLKQEKNILQNNVKDLNTKTDLAIERYQNA